MSKLLNPKTSPALTVLFGGGLIASGFFLSATRIETALAEKTRDDLAQQRANVCRILPANESLELGAYYFQPTKVEPDGSLSGNLLDEGTYVCDRLKGATGRIERGGYIQHMAVATDVTAINKILEKRLKEPLNPDSSPLTQIQRATNMGIYQEPPKSVETEQESTFFKIN